MTRGLARSRSEVRRNLADAKKLAILTGGYLITALTPRGADARILDWGP